MLAEDHARVDPRVWQRAGRAINQRERLRMRYQRFDGATRDYLLELRLRHYTLLVREDAPGSQQGLDAVFVANG